MERRVSGVIALISIVVILSASTVGQRFSHWVTSPLNNLVASSTASIPAGDPGQASEQPQVVRFTTEAYRRRVVINQGEESGISPGDYATVDRSLIGVISEVSARTSIITLSIDPEFKTVAVNQAATQGLATGELNAISLRNIPSQLPLNPGDVVVTSGLDGRFQKDLVVGEVREVFDQSQLLKAAHLAPPYDPLTLNTVQIISND